MAITTVENVKLYLDIPEADTSKDYKIEKLIEVVEADYLNIRNIPFDIVEDEIAYPAGAETVSILMIEHQLNIASAKGKGVVTSESIDNYSVSYQNPIAGTGYPSNITNKIKRYIK